MTQLEAIQSIVEHLCGCSQLPALIQTLIRELEVSEELIEKLSEREFHYPLIRDALSVHECFEIAKASISVRLKEDLSGLDEVYIHGQVKVLGQPFDFRYPLSKLLALEIHLPSVSGFESHCRRLEARFPESLYLNFDLPEFSLPDVPLIDRAFSFDRSALRKGAMGMIIKPDEYYLTLSLGGRKTLVSGVCDVIDPYLLIDLQNRKINIVGTIPMRVFGGDEIELGLDVCLTETGIPRFQIVAESSKLQLLPGLWLSRMGYSYNPTPALGFCSRFSLEEPGSASVDFGSVTAELGAELVNSTIIAEFPRDFRLGYASLIKICTGEELSLPSWAELVVLSDHPEEGLKLTCQYDPIQDQYGFSGKISLFEAFFAATSIRYSLGSGLNFLFYSQPVKWGPIFAITSADDYSKGPLFAGASPMTGNCFDLSKFECLMDFRIMLLGISTSQHLLLKEEALSLSYRTRVDGLGIESEISNFLSLNFRTREFEARLMMSLAVIIRTMGARMKVVGVGCELELKNTDFAFIALSFWFLNQKYEFSFSAHLNDINALPGEVISAIEQQVGDRIMGMFGDWFEKGHRFVREDIMGSDRKQIEKVEENLSNQIRESEERITQAVGREVRDAEIRLQKQLKEQLKETRDIKKELHLVAQKIDQKMDEAARLAVARDKKVAEKLTALGAGLEKTQEDIKRLRTDLTEKVDSVGKSVEALKEELEEAEKRMNEGLAELGRTIGLDIAALREEMITRHEGLVEILAGQRELAEKHHEEIRRALAEAAAGTREHITLSHEEIRRALAEAAAGTREHITLFHNDLEARMTAQTQILRHLRGDIASLARHLCNFEERVELADRRNTVLIRTGFLGLERDIHATRFALSAYHRGAAQSELVLPVRMLEDHVIRAPINQTIDYARYLDPLDKVKYWFTERSCAPELTGSMEALEMSWPRLAADLPRLVQANPRSLAWNVGMLWGIFHGQGFAPEFSEETSRLIANVQLWQWAGQTFTAAAPLLRPEYDPGNRLIREALEQGKQIGLATQRILIEAFPQAMASLWEAHVVELNKTIRTIFLERFKFLKPWVGAREDIPWITPATTHEPPKLNMDRYRECLVSSEAFRALEPRFEELDHRFKAFQYLLKVLFAGEPVLSDDERHLPGEVIADLSKLKDPGVTPQVQFFVLQHLLNDLVKVADTPSFASCTPEELSDMGVFSGSALRQSLLNRPAVLFGPDLEAKFDCETKSALELLGNERRSDPDVADERYLRRSQNALRVYRDSLVTTYARLVVDLGNSASILESVRDRARKISTCLRDSQLVSPALVWGLDSTLLRIESAIEQDKLLSLG